MFSSNKHIFSIIKVGGMKKGPKLGVYFFLASKEIKIALWIIMFRRAFKNTCISFIFTLLSNLSFQIYLSIWIYRQCFLQILIPTTHDLLRENDDNVLVGANAIFYIVNAYINLIGRTCLDRSNVIHVNTCICVTALPSSTWIWLNS